ncbi:HNH endonuclease [Algicola sagamiensis]|uniref:HNH endonuclease n=1 Tax=Algicola sagamiensis TaxID=163869 RepID=UPI0003723DB0|nr:HNH endonuclease [Algicola sagamiensis]
MKKIIYVLPSLFLSTQVQAHAGRLDAQGGHTYRDTGIYHCHKEPCFSLMKKKYSRKNWRHWLDADKDCQNTRVEVLLRDAKHEVSSWQTKRCKVKTGAWQCPYTGRLFTDSSELDIDHIVPLKEAFISGANRWNKSEKTAFANDMDNLLVVEALENRQKGSKDPAQWLPENVNYHCTYIKKWVAVKEKYQLVIDEQEKRAIDAILQNCS